MRFNRFQHTKKRNKVKPTIEAVKEVIFEKPEIKENIIVKEAHQKVGEDFCQLCSSPTKFIGGVDYDKEDFECTNKNCRAVHVMRVIYQNGKRVSSVLESII